ncbi:lysophospholipase [Acidovorax sp. CF316]|uniref:alpha/beta hydrolase n=1 Tax=Acidovorax sp. CF316 TaxID=1144317 RepID=UPI00026BCB5A|nr:alpha/beta fold hydrolase [Acidovorax sp. CF316]EJE52244.1 lysophospholipase [Acidovorax sp. CF316]
MKALLLGLVAVAASLAAVAQPAADPRAKPIEARGPLAPLKGTLLAPARAGAPVVLIVPGSGPTDRDGNNPLGVNAATYKLLAQDLAARGIASVRIDKRGMFGSAKAVADANAVTIPDYVTDVHSWVGAIRRSTGVPCVWVLGHSEGGLVALAVAQGGGEVPGICGLVLVAAPGRPLGQVLRDQLRANPANAPILEQALAAITRLEGGARVDTASLHPALHPLFNEAVQGFLISAFAQDPAKLIAATKVPVLVLQGERDLQVGVQDARLLAQANPAAQLVLLPDTNHVLKAVVTDDPAANMATYANPGQPLAPGVVDAVVRFVAAGKTRP